MKNIKFIQTLSILLISYLFLVPAYGQKRQNPKTALLTVKAQVVNDENQPVKNAQIITGEGSIIILTNGEGVFTAKVKSTSNVMIEAIGYKPINYKLSEGTIPSVIQLEKEEIYANNSAIVNRADGSKVYQRDLVGAVGHISGKSLTTYPDLVVTNALQGKAAGLVVNNNVSGLGNNIPDLYIRGLHGKTNNEAVVVIDGIERPLADLLPEEIESIELLKDPTSKILYGARAANGVLWVTTRRGEANRRTLKITGEMGIGMVTRTPSYLNSYDYAQLYNEARANDGLDPYYSDAQSLGYQNSKGVNDLLYPNVDYYKYFLNSTNQYKKAVMELNGGNENIQYSLVGGYTYGDGIEKGIHNTTLNRFNIRGNLDIKVNDLISISTGVSGRLEIRNWGARDNSQLFSALSTLHPNEYPFTISPSDLGIAASDDSIPFFGGSSRMTRTYSSSDVRTNSLYADMFYGGTNNERYINSQNNLGLNFNLDKYLKGLSATGFITFDNYDYFKQSQTFIYPTYAVNNYINDTGVNDTIYTVEKTGFRDKPNKRRC